ncbi:hypothetical protein ISS85_02325 [Candidatus Microgenomates bacterium]|nr:hypothetical protein [Candidatus Microgenomates bacterium]
MTSYKKSVKDFIDELLEAVALPEPLRRTVFGLYLTSFYRSCFDLLLFLKAHDKVFFKKMNDFLDDQIRLLSKNERNFFEEFMTKKHHLILDEILKEVRSGLNDELKKKFDAQLKNMVK